MSIYHNFEATIPETRNRNI